MGPWEFAYDGEFSVSINHESIPALNREMTMSDL